MVDVQPVDARDGTVSERLALSRSWATAQSCWGERRGDSSSKCLDV